MKGPARNGPARRQFLDDDDSRQDVLPATAIGLRNSQPHQTHFGKLLVEVSRESVSPVPFAALFPWRLLRNEAAQLTSDLSDVAGFR
jgi:hypothetical protein